MKYLVVSSCKSEREHEDYHSGRTEGRDVYGFLAMNGCDTEEDVLRTILGVVGQEDSAEYNHIIFDSWDKLTGESWYYRDDDGSCDEYSIFAEFADYDAGCEFADRIRKGYRAMKEQQRIDEAAQFQKARAEAEAREAARLKALKEQTEQKERELYLALHAKYGFQYIPVDKAADDRLTEAMLKGPNGKANDQ